MNENNTILVVGATGNLGAEICHQLVTEGKNVKALVRNTSDPGKIKRLQDLGIETITGDIKDQQSLSKAFEGIKAVISTVSSTISHGEGDNIESVDRLGQLNVVSAAKAAGVEQFIYISFLASPESFPLQDAKREVEEHIIDSQMQYTILRPTFFMEIWLGPHLGFDPLNGNVTIYGDGNNRISWISFKDVASFAVSALDNPEAHNKIIDLGGPEELSQREVVSLFEEQNDKKIVLQIIPDTAIQSQMQGALDPIQKSFAALMLTLAGGAIVPMKETLSKFPIRLTSVKDYRNMLTGVEVVGA